jgi:hypothetical protein
MGGYFAALESAPFSGHPGPSSVDRDRLAITFDIATGVRHGSEVLKAELDNIIKKEHQEIDAMLNQYHVPVEPAPLSLAAHPDRQTLRC